MGNRMPFHPGLVTVRMANGVVTDDPHLGTPTPLPSPGIIGNSYQFTVKAPSTPHDPAKLQIGSGPGRCSYALVHPWYTCIGSEMCIIRVKALGQDCSSSGGEEIRKVSFATQQEIANRAFELNGGDGAGSLLSYAGGEVW